MERLGIKGTPPGATAVLTGGMAEILERSLGEMRVTHLIQIANELMEKARGRCDDLGLDPRFAGAAICYAAAYTAANGASKPSELKERVNLSTATMQEVAVAHYNDRVANAKLITARNPILEGGPTVGRRR